MGTERRIAVLLIGIAALAAPSLAPLSASAQTSAVVTFALGLTTVDPPFELLGGGGDFRATSTCVTGQGGGSPLVGADLCDIVVEGTYEETACGLMTLTGGGIVSSPGLPPISFTFQEQTAAFQGLLTGTAVDPATGQTLTVVGYLGFYPTGGNCVVGITQVVAQGQLVIG